jgi:DNA-binding GntR family transcriptional regulator
MKASERIRQIVETQIAEGELLPGDPIDEEDLMARFGVSRTPVREALLQLKAENLIDSIPRGGTIVAKMDFTQLLSVWELLADLEGLCARYACERMTRQERQALLEVHQAARATAEQEDELGWLQANRAVHEILYAGARNPYLRQEILRMRIRTSAYRSHSFGVVGRVRNAYQAHERITEAILANDPNSAADVARAHLNPSEAGLLDFIRNMPKELMG